MAKIIKKQSVSKTNKVVKPGYDKIAHQPVKGDYYAGSFWKKVLDFCIGFFWPYITLTIAGLVPNLGYLFNTPLWNKIFTISGIIIALAAGVLFLIFLVKNATERRYVFIGFVAALVAPLVFFIGCLVVLSSIGLIA